MFEDVSIKSLKTKEGHEIMGMSASQVRYLQLTARKSDCEYQAQQISQARLSVSKNLEDIATKYTEGINNRRLMYKASGDAPYQRLTYSVITSSDEGLGYRVVTREGREVVPSKEDPEKIREAAREKYEQALSRNCFQFGADAASLAGKAVSGASFLSYFMPDTQSALVNAVENKDGQILSTEELRSEISGLDAGEFYDYWQKKGLSFTNGKELESREYTEDIERAKAEYEREMARADQVEQQSYFIDKDCLDDDYLEEKLRSGEWLLSMQKLQDDGTREWEDISYSGVGNIFDNLYTDDDASVSAEYETKSAYYQQKDKELELQMKQLETERSAISSELEALKKVVDDNVKSSFKTFSA